MHGLWALTLRSLRSDSRLIRFHGLRVGVAAFSFFALISLNSSLSETAPGRILLLAMLGMNLYFVTWGGALLFAPVIAEEKEASTLGLLRMTGIGPAALILGSFLPKLIQVGLILVVQFPMFCLTVTLGGVDWSHVWAAVLVVATQLVFVASASVLSSVVFRTSGRAIAGVIIVSLLWSNLSRAVLGAIGNNWSLFSLFHHVQLMQASGASSQGVELAVALHLALSVGFLLLAIGLFDRFNLHEISGEPTQSPWQRFQSYLSPWAYRRIGSVPPGESQRSSAEPAGVIRAPQRATLPVWQNSLAWKEFTFLGGGWMGLLLRLCLAFGGVLFIAADGFSEIGQTRWIYESILYASLWPLSIDLVYLTVNLFGAEIRGQTWETLQTLPVPLGVICRQKVLGAARQLIPWVMIASLGAFQAGWLGMWLDRFLAHPGGFCSTALHFVLQIVACATTLIMLSLRWNPWIATVVTGVIHWVIFIGVLFSALTTFGFMGPPSPRWWIVAFNLAWGLVLSVGIVANVRAIRRRLNPGGVEW